MLPIHNAAYDIFLIFKVNLDPHRLECFIRCSFSNQIFVFIANIISTYLIILLEIRIDIKIVSCIQREDI